MSLSCNALAQHKLNTKDKEDKKQDKDCFRIWVDKDIKLTRNLAQCCSIYEGWFYSKKLEFCQFFEIPFSTMLTHNEQMRKTEEREQNRTEQISENENKKMFCVLPDYQPKVWSNS